MSSCPHCGVTTVWDDELGSAVCTVCGTLADSSQSALISHLDNHDNSARQYDYLPIPSSSTLKSIRSRHGWNLAGQGKEARDIKNNYAMHEFIRSILSNLSVPGVSTRAITLFSQAMDAGKYRWGRKAKLTAAASIAIALRESHRSDSLRDIAFLIDEPPLALSRTFISVLNVLKLSLTSADPATHFPALCSYLSSLLHVSPESSLLSRTLIDLVKPLSLTSVTHTAHALSTLISRLGQPNMTGLPTPPTASALLILGLEAEARISIPGLEDLAQLLGDRFGVGKRVVLSRYKLIYDVVEEWIRVVPWLDKFASVKGRSKLSKRLVVARGLKDVLQFQEQIWRKKLETLPRPNVVLDSDVVADDSDETQDKTGQDFPGPHRKRRLYQEMPSASCFLLDPLSTITTSSKLADPTRRSPLPAALYLLTADDAALSLRNTPTRLQRLVAERGGEGEIMDDELLDEGEWETIVRSEEERDALRDVLRWDIKESPKKAHGGNNVEPALERKTDEGACFQGRQEKSRTDVHMSGRINMEAYLKLMHELEGDEGDEEYQRFALGYSFHHPVQEELRIGENPGSSPVLVDEEVVESWRPVSPNHSRYFDVSDRYDEEY